MDLVPIDDSKVMSKYREIEKKKTMCPTEDRLLKSGYEGSAENCDLCFS